jgi:hypothetical protein
LKSNGYVTIRNTATRIENPPPDLRNFLENRLRVEKS